MPEKSKTVVVGLSGGVDSAVAAALLLEQGYRVVGASLALWKAGEIPHNHGEKYQDARMVAKHLGIPWKLIDKQAAFRDEIVTYYLNSLKTGKTPIPCIVCNSKIKWRTLLEVAEEMKADYVATGHYARRYESDTIEIHQARDISKDQSYFLARLGQLELFKTLFPLGEYSKDEVRMLAKQKAIPVADRLESQDLCFMGDMEQENFIMNYAPGILIKGEIVHRDGRILGEHTGLANYTEGQRKGIRIAYSSPLYVLKKDLQRNRLIVAEKEYLGISHLTASEVKWIRGTAPGKEFQATVKIRYGPAGYEGTVKLMTGDRLEVRFSHKISSITPGQAMVMYQGENCLGMGFIE
jgi:tRNA-specific 2-thiouridylase